LVPNLKGATMKYVVEGEGIIYGPFATIAKRQIGR
jgi:hypothetical protein